MTESSAAGPKLLHQRALAALLIEDGWLDANQSNSAHAMAESIYRLRDLPVEDHAHIVKLLDIVLRHNYDPNDTDVAGTVVELLDYVKNNRRCPQAVCTRYTAGPIQGSIAGTSWADCRCYTGGEPS